MDSRLSIATVVQHWRQIESMVPSALLRCMNWILLGCATATSLVEGILVAAMRRGSGTRYKAATSSHLGGEARTGFRLGRSRSTSRFLA